MASRGFSTTINNMLAAGQADLAILVYLDWPTSPIYAWSGNGTVSWNSQSWLGVGDFGQIDKVADTADKSDVGIELTFNYLDDTARNELAANDPIGRAASVYLAAMNIATAQVADAYEIFPGFMDRIDIEDAGEKGRIVVRIASEAARLNRPMAYQLTDAHQQSLFAGDLGMQFAAKMSDPVTWGRKPTVVAAPAAPGYTNPPIPWGQIPWGPG